jgi:TPR repeat protein
MRKDSIQQNAQKAIKLYEKEITMNIGWTMNHLESGYKNGKGVWLNYVKVLKLFNKAGDVGICQALFQSLAFDYKEIGVKRYLAKCDEKWKLSIEQDCIHAYIKFTLFKRQT